jgi:hypothetical protein
VHNVNKYTPAVRQSESTRVGRGLRTWTSLTPERLAIVGRLLRIGFPIHHASLLRQYPLRIHVDGGETRALTNGGTAILLWIRIAAVSRVTFDRFEVRRADNTPLDVEWADYCDTHEHYCVHDPKRGAWCADHPLSQTLRTILAISPKKCMTYGDVFEGCILGESRERLPPNILLAFIDTFESEFLFPMSVPAPS